MNTELTAKVITVSDRASAGVYIDLSGPIVVEGLTRVGFKVEKIELIPDELIVIQTAISDSINAGTRLIVTTGGTGVSPRDVTPEATAPLLEKELPGVSEAIRSIGQDRNPKASISRGLSGVSKHSLIINLPGSPSGVRDGLQIIHEVAIHIIEQLDGKSHVE